MPSVSRHIEEIAAVGADHGRVPLRYVVKTTPSSMHSLYELSHLLPGGEPFCVTTVDTIFREDEFAAYIGALSDTVGNGSDGLMGVTDFVDDEKPLYVGTDEQMNVTGFYDTESHCRYISAGIYGLTPKAFRTLDGCISRGESRMRNFQRALVADGEKLKAYAFSKVLDIDHATDIVKAEQFLMAQANNNVAQQ